jgi:hypothetical protein
MSARGRDPPRMCRSVTPTQAGADRSTRSLGTRPVPMLAELIDAVVGVDTHRDTHQVDIALPNGAPITLTTVSNDTTGYAHPPAQGQPGPTADHRHDIAPGLLERRRIGPVSAAQAIVSFSHPGRCRNDAAFAALAGANPLPASSGPRGCLALGCRWPRPRGCWLVGSAARRGRHGGMSSGPRAVGRSSLRRPRRCSQCGCPRRWLRGCGSGLGSREARSPPWSCRH